jgi:uncharacterized protein YegP (UPF0339 family)
MNRAIAWALMLVAIVVIGWSSLIFRPTPARAADAEKKAAAKFEVYKDKSGDYRWRLRTSNTNVIASSGQGYKSKQGCLDGIESVKKNAADAPVEEVAAGAGAEK